MHNVQLGRGDYFAYAKDTKFNKNIMFKEDIDLSLHFVEGK